MSIYNSENRTGNFTSSEIVALTIPGTRPMTQEELENRQKGERRITVDCMFGKKALTYIEETNMERQSGLPLTCEVLSDKFVWGHCGEIMLFDNEHILDSSYKWISEETIVNPSIPFLSGSPDGIRYTDLGHICVEAKAPATRKSYLTAYNCKDIFQLRELHDEGDKYYWQCVNNASLLKTHKCELIFYCPYQKELEAIREICRTSKKLPQEHLWKYMQISNKTDDELPYLHNDERVNHIKIFSFYIPPEDKIFLEERVIEAGKLLIKI